MNPAIELVSLSKVFGDVRAVDAVDLEVPPGSFLVLLGPSGCGKTTILRMLAGLELPTDGDIRLEGRSVANGREGLVVPAVKRNAGLVFQSYALWPHMTVRGNVEWPLKIKHLKMAQRRERSTEVLALLGIEELGDRYPGEISGGQQQRVAIARMIATEPSVLLFDEPLSNLDAKLRVEMRTELLRVHRATGATSVYVTHDQVEAMTMATHVAVMREGRVEQFGTPLELVAEPATTFVATFMGTPSANVIPVKGREKRLFFGAADVGAVPESSQDTDIWAMYRPEKLKLHEEAGGRRAAFEFAEATPLAGRYVVTGWVDGLRLSVITDEPPGLALGTRLFVEFPSHPDVLFGADGRRLDSEEVSA